MRARCPSQTPDEDGNGLRDSVARPATGLDCPECESLELVSRSGRPSPASSITAQEGGRTVRFGALGASHEKTEGVWRYAWRYTEIQAP